MQKKTVWEKLAILLLLTLLSFAFAIWLHSRFLALASVLFLTAVLFYCSYMAGIKGHSELLSVNLGTHYGKAVAVLISVLGLALIIGVLYLFLTDAPMNF